MGQNFSGVCEGEHRLRMNAKFDWEHPRKEEDRMQNLYIPFFYFCGELYGQQLRRSWPQLEKQSRLSQYLNRVDGPFGSVSSLQGSSQYPNLILLCVWADYNDCSVNFHYFLWFSPVYFPARKLF